MDLHDLWYELTERGRMIPESIYGGLDFFPDPVQGFLYGAILLLINFVILLFAWRSLSYVVIGAGSRLLLSDYARRVINIGQDAENLHRFDTPVRLLVFAFVAHHYLEAWIFSLLDPVWYVNLEKLASAITAGGLIWVVLRFCHHIASRPQIFTKITGISVPERVIPFLKSALTFVFGLTASILILDQVGVPLALLISLSATIGIGVSLGAKDTFADMIAFGGILLNNPFQIGDEVSIDWTRGKVEDIGVSHVRLRTSDGSVCAIPNNCLGNATVINHSRRDSTAVEIVMRLHNRTVRRLEDALGQIRAKLDATPDVDFNAAAATEAGETVEVRIDMRFRMTDRYQVMEYRSHLMLDVLEILNDYDVELAAPYGAIITASLDETEEMDTPIDRVEESVT